MIKTGSNMDQTWIKHGSWIQQYVHGIKPFTTSKARRCSTRAALRQRRCKQQRRRRSADLSGFGHLELVPSGNPPEKNRLRSCCIFCWGTILFKKNIDIQNGFESFYDLFSGAINLHDIIKKVSKSSTGCAKPLQPPHGLQGAPAPPASQMPTPAALQSEPTEAPGVHLGEDQNQRMNQGHPWPKKIICLIIV